MADSYHTSVASLRPLGGFDETREEWQRLAADSDNVFATWEWNALWWRRLGQGELALTGACDPAGELRAILPLYVRDGTGRFVGHGESDQLGPVCAPPSRQAAARALVEALHAGELPCARLLLEDVPQAERWDRLPGARRLDGDPSPVLRAPDGWEEFLASRTRHFRAAARAHERRLARRHELRFRLCQAPEQVAPDMETLFRLHRTRWGTASGALRGVRADLHRDFAAVALDRGWLRLWTLALDGEPAASQYGLRFGSAESVYQTGRDPARASEGVGFVLLVHAIRCALDDGADEYRFLRGDEAYKRRFANADAPIESYAVE